MLSKALKNTVSRPENLNRMVWRGKCALLLAAPGMACATNYDAANTADLITAINAVNAGAGGDTITLTADVTLSNLLPALNQTVSIDGGNHTLSGNSSVRVLTITGGNITLLNANLINGRAVGGNGGTGGAASATFNTVGGGGGGGAGFAGGITSNGGNGGDVTSASWPPGGTAGTNASAGGSQSNAPSTSLFGAGGGGGAGHTMSFNSYSGSVGGFGGGPGGTGGQGYTKATPPASGGGGGGGGSLGAGGAIYTQGGTLTLQNVTLDNNAVSGGAGGAGGASFGNGYGGNGGNGGAGFGGALFVNGTVLSLNDSSFGVSNSAVGGAGGAGGTNDTPGHPGSAGSAGATGGRDVFLYSGTLNQTVTSGTISAQIAADTSVAGTLNKFGNGTLILSGTAGLLNPTVTAGVLGLGASNLLADNATVAVNGGTFDLGAFSDTIGSLSLTSGNIVGNGTLRATQFNVTSGNVSVILGTGTLTKSGAGTVVLSKANNYTGATIISGGTLQIGNGGTTGALSTSSAITNNGVLAFNRSDAVTQGTHFRNGVISGNGSVAQLGAGTLTLSSTHTYTGGTSINAGTLALGGAIGNSTILANSGNLSIGGGTLDLARHNETVAAVSSTAGTITSTGGAGNLTGSGFTKSGNGTTTINTGVTYRGGSTTVSGGTLRVNGTIANTGNTSVGAGAVLAGSGQVLNPVTVASGGKTLPSAGGLVRSVLKLDLQYDSGSSAESAVSSGTTTAGTTTGYDQVVVTVNDLRVGTGNATTQLAARTDGSAASGVSLGLNMTAATFAELAAGAGPYDGLGANTALNNFFAFNLDNGLNTVGLFESVALTIDGMVYTGAIEYGGTGFGRFGNVPGASFTLGDVTVNGQEFAISYTGNFASNSTLGGNDIVLTAIPEPGSLVSLLAGLGLLLGLRRGYGVRQSSGALSLPAAD